MSGAPLSYRVIPPQLVTVAFEILTRDLAEKGNVLSPHHRAALFEILDCFTRYCQGREAGRKAFGLPTGMGKTSAIVAFIVALHQCGCAVPVAVSASKVEALCQLKDTLQRLGVPEELIGLKHSLLRASMPSTGNESRLYQLVTHARVRGQVDEDLFCKYQGEPRALMIYDETFLRGTSMHIDFQELKACYGALGAFSDTNSGVATARTYIEQCMRLIGEAIERLRAAGDPEGVGETVFPPERTEEDLAGYCQVVQHSRLANQYANVAAHFFKICDGALRVLATPNGSGVLWAAEVIPTALRDVVILDASHPIRELARLDTSITAIETYPVDALKTFENVEIFQLLAGGGRSSIRESYRALTREKSAVSREVVDIIRENWGTCRGILVFTFKKREVDILGQLQRDLDSEGIDLKAQVFDADGKQQDKVRFLTWGEETSLNGFEYCEVVIMAGVLQRSGLDIAAAIRGQSLSDLGTPYPTIRNVIESEVAHCIYQGASRGSCRRMQDGVAMPMRLYFIHKSQSMRGVLNRVMPKAVWQYRDLNHLTQRSEGNVMVLANTLLEYLDGLPQGVLKLSSKRVKRALGIGTGSAENTTFTRALRTVVKDNPFGEWRLDGRSFVRVDQI